MDRLLNRDFNIFDLIAALFVVLLIVAFQVASTTPVMAACTEYVGYRTFELKTLPPVDKWGDATSPPDSLSPTQETIVFTYFAHDGDDPATPDVEQPGQACTP